MEGHASYNAETTEPALRVARDALRDDGRLVVESLDPNCFMLLIEDEAGAEVVMRDDDGPKRYLGDVRVYRNGEGEPMVSIADEGGAETRVFLAAVERIVIL
jgi:hypothetical protein